MNPEQDKTIAVIAAHMEHFGRDMAEMKTDLKSIPDKMATAYVPKGEFDEHRKDHTEMRTDLKALIGRIDAGQFVTKEESKEFLTKDQFSPYKWILIFVSSAIVTGIIKFGIDLFANAVR